VEDDVVAAAKGGMMRRVFCALIACLAAVPAIAADAPERLPPIAVFGNITTFEIAPVLLAADRLYPGEAKVSMGSLSNLVGAPGVPGYQSTGKADVATNAETQALRYSVDHPDLRIIMTVSEGLYRIVAKRSSGIAKLADLKGKRIGTVPGTSSGYFLHRMLASVGLSEADVTVVPVLPITDMPKALAEGKVDAITIWEPEVEKAAETIGADAIEFSGKGVYRELFNLNTTAEALADPEKRRRIVAFVRAIIAASKAINADPDVAFPLVEKGSGYPRDLIAKSWKHQLYPANLAADLLDVMTIEEQFLAAQAKRPARTRAELARLIDPSVLKEAQKPGKR
jgi:NitT/TauT family transport system substrate-binding protein